jgi:hypothetical protein
VRHVVSQHDDAAGRKAGAQLQVEVGAGNGTNHGHDVHLLGLDARQVQAGFDGPRGEAAIAVPMGAAADELRFLDGGGDFAVLQDGGGGVAQDAADSENDHVSPSAETSPRRRGDAENDAEKVKMELTAEARRRRENEGSIGWELIACAASKIRAAEDAEVCGAGASMDGDSAAGLTGHTKRWPAPLQ